MMWLYHSGVYTLINTSQRDTEIPGQPCLLSQSSKKTQDMEAA